MPVLISNSTPGTNMNEQQEQIYNQEATSFTNGHTNHIPSNEPVVHSFLITDITKINLFFLFLFSIKRLIY